MSVKYSLIKAFSRFVPRKVRPYFRSSLHKSGYFHYMSTLENPYEEDLPYCTYPDYPIVIGIVREFYNHHRYYIAACHELRQSFRLVDISGPDWVNGIEESDCNIFLVWPSAASTVWRTMFDDRLKILEYDMSKFIYPTYREIWLYENKYRTLDWFVLNNIPHPKTWVFYNCDEALAFVNNAELPLVFKTNLGSGASGVKIIKERKKAVETVRNAFTKGILPRGKHPLDRQWGSVYFQEYLPNVKEWRMVRMGDSYFGHTKEKAGEFHSGSLLKGWFDPPRELLNLMRSITDRGQFTSMNIDIFETEDGRFLVNELHSVFGQSTPELLRVNGKPGRYVYHPTNDEWLFEEGDFTRNACANLRINFVREKFLS